MKNLICSFLVCLLCVVVFAQDNRSTDKASTPEQGAERVTKWMTKKLALTADQKSKVYAINLKYAKLSQETRFSNADNRKAMLQELKASEKEREGEFKTILTSEQFQSFQSAKQELLEKGTTQKKQD